MAGAITYNGDVFPCPNPTNILHLDRYVVKTTRDCPITNNDVRNMWRYFRLNDTPSAAKYGALRSRNIDLSAVQTYYDTIVQGFRRFLELEDRAPEIFMQFAWPNSDILMLKLSAGKFGICTHNFPEHVGDHVRLIERIMRDEQYIEVEGDVLAGADGIIVADIFA